MEDKRGIKRARSPSKEGSPSPDGAKTPPSAPSGSPSPLMSPLEVSSCCHCSPVLEQGGSSGKTPVVDLSSSSDEGDLIADVSQDEEFARNFFDDLNHDVLGHLVTAKSSSSVTPMKKRRCARRKPLTSKLCHLLL
jgi:hypothetical protein